MALTAEEWSGDSSTMTFAEYLRFEEQSPFRHEWVQGHVFAMTGGTIAHERTVQALFLRFHPEVRRRGCEVFTHNRRLRIGTPQRPDASYYPDLLVRCGPPEAVLYEADASLIAEVKSPSTWREDRREKALAYLRVPSLERYLIVDPVYHLIEVGTPVDGHFNWETFEEDGVIATPYGALDVADFYAKLEAVS